MNNAESTIQRIITDRLIRPKKLEAGEHTDAPTIGAGATLRIWSDRHACTVLDCTATTVTLRADKARRVDRNGMSDSQSYEYEENPQGTVYRATRRKLRDGSFIWKLVGVKTNENGGVVTFGVRREYHDFSF